MGQPVLRSPTQQSEWWLAGNSSFQGPSIFGNPLSSQSVDIVFLSCRGDVIVALL